MPQSGRETGGELLKQDKTREVRTTKEKREAILKEFYRRGMIGAEFEQHVGTRLFRPAPLGRRMSEIPSNPKQKAHNQEVSDIEKQNNPNIPR